MDLFTFVAWVLVVAIVVTILWPLNIPLLALACKVRQGTKPLDYEPTEFWVRCTFGTLGLAVMSVLLVGITYGLVQELELRSMGTRGAVHLVLLMVYVAAAVGYLFWMLALEDPFQALAVFLLYVGLPGVPLFLLGWLLGFGGRVVSAAPWLL